MNYLWNVFWHPSKWRLALDLAISETLCSELSNSDIVTSNTSFQVCASTLATHSAWSTCLSKHSFDVSGSNFFDLPVLILCHQKPDLKKRLFNFFCESRCWLLQDQEHTVLPMSSCPYLPQRVGSALWCGWWVVQRTILLLSRLFKGLVDRGV